jgi:hypothetical protein
MTSLINGALMRLSLRAERTDPRDLVETFVSAGPIFNLLASTDHQILYGRRGTGKTHVLQYLIQQHQFAGDVAVYVDLRTIGSSGGIYSDTQIPITERGTRLLCDVLSKVYNELMDRVLDMSYLSSEQDYTAAMAMLDQLGRSITDVRVTGDEERTTNLLAEASEQGKAAASFTVALNPSLSLSGGGTSGSRNRMEAQSRVSGPLRHRVHFGAVSESLEGLTNNLSGRLWLILDEWSDVPLELQPLLADLLRRCVMTVRGITVKIGEIEQRSNFRQLYEIGRYIGFELGSDISANINLDDFMVFDNDKIKARDFFSELFFKHVRNLLKEEDRSQVQSSQELIGKGFTQQNAFEELVRAAEGVPRDAINIAMMAALGAGDSSISIPIIRTAARKWYLQDKEPSVRDNRKSNDLLRWIIDEVIGTRRARAFLLKQGSSASHPLISALYDARVLHLIKHGVSGHDSPGVRFDVYALDYGCYVHLTNTAAEPDDFFEVSEVEDLDSDFGSGQVPNVDYRSIRRAILDLDRFEAHETDASLEVTQ